MPVVESQGKAHSILSISTVSLKMLYRVHRPISGQ